jgi:general stress protein 26
MKEKELKQECVKLMETAEIAYLSTVDSDGFPQTRAMVNLRNIEQFSDLASVFQEHQEDLLIYVTTDTASNIIKCPI